MVSLAYVTVFLACQSGPAYVESDAKGSEIDSTEPAKDTVTDTATDTATDTGANSDSAEVSPPPSASITIGTWNLHNFSKYGPGEFRINDIAQKIQSLNVDALAVQELKVKEGTKGEPPQAWDVLLEKMPGYDGIHAPWDDKDSTVGIIYRTSTTTVLSSEVLFETDWSAFPRPPIEVHLKITHDGKSSEIRVIVLHLKAFKDSVDRRREACKKLDTYIQNKTDKRYLIIGDFNDDPYDKGAANSYTGTFLDNEPKYYFLTASLPPESVTSTGYYHYVNGKKLTGEFLDHAVITGEALEPFESATPSILGVPSSQFSQWKSDYSDHFPVLVEFTPKK
jgi:endonuclease/exonuclease/phosphatase family metal-dependent hydrolase